MGWGKALILASRNRDISQFFEVLPDRKVFMDYYRAIGRPISLRDIEVGFRMMFRSLFWKAADAVAR